MTQVTKEAVILQVVSTKAISQAWAADSVKITLGLVHEVTKFKCVESVIFILLRILLAIIFVVAHDILIVALPLLQSLSHQEVLNVITQVHTVIVVQLDGTLFTVRVIDALVSVVSACFWLAIKLGQGGAAANELSVNQKLEKIIDKRTVEAKNFFSFV